MGKPVNKALIGVFVLGAVALAVAAMVIFGSGKFFTQVKKFVMFYEGSVKGLSVGSPVIFRGVKIGEVKEIRLMFNPKNMTGTIPVYVEIDPRTFAVPRGVQIGVNGKRICVHSAPDQKGTQGPAPVAELRDGTTDGQP